MTLDTYQIDNLTTTHKPKAHYTDSVIEYTSEGFFSCEFYFKLGVDSNTYTARKVILSAMVQSSGIFKTGKKPIIKFKYLGNTALGLFVTFWIEEENVMDAYAIAESLAIETINRTSETLEKAGFILLD